jgi:hypothetical protein
MLYKGAIKCNQICLRSGGHRQYADISGFPPGLEAENGSWDVWISGTNSVMPGIPSLHYMFGTEVFKYLVYNDPSWNYSQYDFKNFLKETAYAAAFLNATNTDYTSFKKLNGKMIMYHGWNDPALSALATIGHYEDAMSKDKTCNQISGYSCCRVFFIAVEVTVLTMLIGCS